VPIFAITQKRERTRELWLLSLYRHWSALSINQQRITGMTFLDDVCFQSLKKLAVIFLSLMMIHRVKVLRK
jgi:hypothetical protein